MHLCFLGTAVHIILQEQVTNLKVSQRSKRVWQSGSCCRPWLLNVRCVQKTHKGVSSCRISVGPPAHQEPMPRPPVFLQHSADTLKSCSHYNHQWWSNLEMPLSSLLHQPTARSSVSHLSSLFHQQGALSVTLSSASASTTSAFPFPSLLVSLPLLAFPCPTNP